MAGSPSGGLEKKLGLFDVYALATGATLSAGLFLLPGLAASQAGPAVVLSYLLAAIPLVPAMLCTVELATAMPKAGGSYYFLERSLGPMLGTVGGFGTWLALTLKTSFALVGLGAYVALFFEPAPWVMKLLAAGFAVAFGVLNALGSAKTGRFQQLLVIGLLAVLAIFLAGGVPQIELARFDGFFGKGSDAILATAGLVYISYVGVTKVASVAEEVADPERNLPRGVFLSLATALLVYVLATVVMVGVLPMDALGADMTPMASAAEVVGGRTGRLVVSIGAMLAFFSVANAGILAASRYPLAMGRDELVPPALCKLDARGTPLRSIALTVAVIVAVVLLLDPLKIAKLASAFQLLMFALLCLAVVVMRESGLDSYDPGYRSPLYPWVPLLGMVAPFLLIFQMGWLPTLFSLGLITAGIAWYRSYGARRVERRGAIYHVFARLGEARHEALDTELRGILKEKGLRSEDPFEEVVLESLVLDLQEVREFDRLIQQVSMLLAGKTGRDATTFEHGFTEGTKTGATPVAKGIALPHMHLDDLDQPLLVLVRVRSDFQFVAGDVFGREELTEQVHAAFFLVSPRSDPARHLRMLAQLASRIDQDDFEAMWRAAQNEMQLREVFLRDDRYLSLRVGPEELAASWAGLQLRDLRLPDGCLIAAIRRRSATLVPRGATRIEEGDRLLLFGEPAALAEVRTSLETP